MNIIQREQKYDCIIKDTLANHNIDGSNMVFHVNPTDKYVTRETAFLANDGVKESMQLLKETIDKNKKISIVVDSDMDGYSSATLMYRFIRDDLKHRKTNYIIHDDKKHGLTEGIMEKVLKDKPDLLIIPDAASNDVDNLKALFKEGISIIVIDHHDIDKKLDSDIPVYVLNNQTMINVNKELTGVGMVYLYCKTYCYLYSLNIDVDKYLDLVSLGQTGDMSDLADKELRYYITKGLSNINNRFIKETLKKKNKPEEPSSRDLSFSIISMVNSVTRVGTIKEKELLFEAFINDSEEIQEIEVRKKNKKTGKMDTIKTEMTVEEVALKESEKVKNRQDRLKRELSNDIKQKLDYTQPILIGIIEENDKGSVNGVIANALLSENNKPVLVLTRGEDSFYGSARGYEPYIESFKDWCLETGLFTLAQGHANAFGVVIPEENMPKLRSIISQMETIKDVDIVVDKIYDKPEPYDIEKIDRQLSVFGGSVPIPLLAYENIKFNIACVRTRGSVLTLFDNGLEFVSYGTRGTIKEEIESNLTNKTFRVNIIGEPSMNDWGNTRKPQVVIRKIEILPKEESVFNDDDLYDF